MEKFVFVGLVGLVFMLSPLFFPKAARAEGRLVDLEGAYNVRDLGGYAAGLGKTVKPGLVYRSGDLHSLSGRDVRELARRGIKTVVDFRTDGERETEPHKLPETVVSVIALPITPGNLPDFASLSKEGAADMMLRVNRDLVTEARPQYAAFFKALADPDNQPLLFNCSAGKDRTGLAAAFFLVSLGVDRETVYRDYLLSAACLKDKYRHMLAKHPDIGPALTVRREYLEAAFAEIDARYGGIDAYLRDQLSVDADRMRQLYTE